MLKTRKPGTLTLGTNKQEHIEAAVGCHICPSAIQWIKSVNVVLWIAHQPECCSYSLPLRAFSSVWSKLPSLPAFLPTRLCSRSPSLPPLWHRGTWKFPGSHCLLRLCLTEWDCSVAGKGWAVCMDTALPQGKLLLLHKTQPGPKNCHQ